MVGNELWSQVCLALNCLESRARTVSLVLVVAKMGDFRSLYLQNNQHGDKPPRLSGLISSGSRSLIHEDRRCMLSGRWYPRRGEPSLATSPW